MVGAGIMSGAGAPVDLETDMAELNSGDATDQRLSALIDGELDEHEIDSVLSNWRNDGAARARWHAYQLIGDVLRSDELASAPARDSALISQLRVRLAAEPVVLAPAPSIRDAAIATGRRGRSGRWSWMASSAIAAGFVAVAGALLVSRSPIEAPGPVVAQATPAPQSVARVSAPIESPAPATGAATAEPESLVANGQLIRDANLDRYLAAHKQFATTSALGAPSGFLRNASTDVPVR